MLCFGKYSCSAHNTVLRSPPAGEIPTHTKEPASGFGKTPRFSAARAANSPFLLLLLLSRAASWVRKKVVLPTSKICRHFPLHRLGRVSFIATFGYSAICSGRCSSYLQVRLENLVICFCSGNFLETSPIFLNDGIFNRRKSWVPHTPTQTSPGEGCTLPLTRWLAAEDSRHCCAGS